MLELNKVSKTFNPGTVNEKKALDGLSVTLAEGDFVTIVGSNGAGKSTFFNAVAGDFFVDEGSIRLDGADITYLPAYRRSRQIGRLFQDPMRGTAPHMTIEENLALAYLRTAKHQHAFFSRVSKADKAFFREQLARLDMGLEDPDAGLLSSGSGVRVPSGVPSFSKAIRYGGCSSVGRASDCGSECRGFESRHPPHKPLRRKGRSVRSGPLLLEPARLGCSQVVRHGTLTPAFAGSSPATPAI